MGKILLVDGNSILNRGYYGLPLLSDKNGVYTNGILGFLNILFKVIDEEKPDYLTVAFDVNEPTFRHKMFEGYKGTRKPAPAELVMQFPIIREVLSSMAIRIVEIPGYEADDLLGTMAKKSEKAGHEVTLLSGDRDLLQIASEHIKISIPKTAAGKTEMHLYYAADVLSEYGVTPTEFIDVKALQGDTSDNIPGVPKVGPKSATDLISRYHSLEGVYEHIDEITAKALHANLVEYKDQAFMSKTLATIETNAPVEPDFDNTGLDGMLNDNSMAVLLKYSLKSIITKLEAFDAGKSGEETKSIASVVDYKVIEDFDETNKLFDKIAGSRVISIIPGENGIAVSFSKDETYYVREYGFVTKDYLKDHMKEALKSVSKVITYEIKNLYPYTDGYSDRFEDIELLAYLLEPNKGEYSISFLDGRYISVYRGDDKSFMADNEKYTATAACDAMELFKVLYEGVKELSMEDLYRDIEMPLSYVLYSMEKEGVLVDKNALSEYGDSLYVTICELEKKIYEAAGCEFNINSPKQLGEVLFEKLNLPYGKKTKSGYSTAADVLDKLAGEYPIVKDILEYRTLSKLKSTYADGLSAFITGDGRIHTHFNQTITATGRISSTEPNLQNIPIRTELGRKLRRVFYPKDGYVFVDADYSQIELRLMAHMSGDENLIKAFNEGEDIHRSTASRVFKKPLEEVTPTERRNAKAVNFGIIYGISAYGLSQDIDVPVYEAKQYIEDYFVTFPGVKNYLDTTVNNARNDGFTKTLYGRIRPIPEIKDSNFMKRSFGERVAMNAPIQGTAADIMKIAMIRIFNRMKDEGLESRLLIQVHDEVLIETRESELSKVIEIVTQEMNNAASLSVRLEVDAKPGKTWFDAH